jgi:hypothetical protein
MIDCCQLPIPYGSIAVEESGHGGLAVLSIHGNWLCRDVFRNQSDCGTGEFNGNH